MNDLPLFWQIVIAVGGLLGAKEVVMRTYDYFLGKPKAKLELGLMSEEQRALHLTNEGTKLDQMQAITKRMEELLARTESLGSENTDLRQRIKVEEKRVIERDAVIKYQKDEILELHTAIGRVREQMGELKQQNETISAAHAESTRLIMRLTAEVEALKNGNVGAAEWKEGNGQSE